MGKLRNNSYNNNKPKHKPSSPRPAGKNYVKRSNVNRTDNENDDNEVAMGGKTYQKAVQARDRYREMAREALVSGDRVAAENYHQHADHYGRIINAAHEAEQEKLKLRKQREDDREAHTPAAEASACDAVAEPITHVSEPNGDNENIGNRMMDE
jgi:hypothetical protein